MWMTGLPSLRDSIRQPLHVFEGEDALLTCVVRNLESNTLLWKREDRERGPARILTAGENRVSSDGRFNVLHDSGWSHFYSFYRHFIHNNRFFPIHISMQCSSNSSWLRRIR